jgi:sterol desaturase/sphingolipid hydroxylase (fatty acid hydroxylase superfamily)
MLKSFIRYFLFPTTLLLGTGVMLYGIERKLSLEVLALIIVVASASIVYLSERLLPYRKNWNISQQDVNNDVISLFVILTLLEPVVKISTVWISSIILMAIGNSISMELFPADWALIYQLVIFSVVAEFGRYWMHRWSHNNKYLWRFHVVHHCPSRLYQFNGYRIHPLNYLWNYFLGQFPLVLLGASQEVILLYFVFSSIIAAFQHANIDSKSGFLNWIFSTNELHRWHHTTDQSIGHKNHGSVLIIWDIVFGSYFSDKTALTKNKVLNTVGIHSPKYYPSNNYIKQLMAPFCWRSCTSK